MAVIYEYPADYEAAKIIADALQDQLVQVTLENEARIWDYIKNTGVFTFWLVGKMLIG
jgi:hypothetical protein